MIKGVAADSGLATGKSTILQIIGDRSLKRDSILIGDTRVEFTVNRSKRRKRTVSLLIHPQQGLVVSAPVNTSMARIREIVQDKGTWIIKQLNDVAAAGSTNENRQYATGEPLWLLGQVRCIKIVVSEANRKIECRENGDDVEVVIPPGLDPGDTSLVVRDALVKWYKKKAFEIIMERVNVYAPILDLYPSKILIREQKTRWGSCSHKGVLRFNWRIIMTPVELVDYIVVHELCHLRVPNHSAEFWSLVSSIIPDCKERRTRLRKVSLYYEF